MRQAFISHVLPSMASATFCGIVDYGLSRSFLFGAGAGGVASAVYNIARDILAKTVLGKNTLKHNIARHSIAILASAGAVYAIAMAAAVDGVIVMPSLAAMGAIFATAITVSMLFRKILGKFVKIPLPKAQPKHVPNKPKPAPIVQPPVAQPVANPQETARQQRIQQFRSDEAMRTAAPLVTVLKQNKYEFADWLINDGANVNCQNDKGETPLSVAVSQGQQALADKLIAKGAKLDCIDHEGNRLIHQAVKGGNIPLIAKFLTPANKEARNKTHCTPLALAVQLGKIDVAKYLVSQGANSRTDAAGSTLLHHAAIAGNVPMMNWVLTLGLVIERRDNKGYTAIAKAVEKGNLAVADRLLASGAIPNAKTDEEDGIAHIAVQTGKLEILRWIKNTNVYLDNQNKSGLTPFSLAVLKNYQDCAQVLFAERPEPDRQVRDREGRTLLHLAVLSQSSDNLKWVLSLEQPQAPLKNVRDRAGYTALMLATEKGNFKMAKRLAESGENPRDMGPENRSLLHLAAMSGSCDLIQWAKAFSFPINEQDDQGYTPLALALERGHNEAAKLLIASGAQ